MARRGGRRTHINPADLVMFLDSVSEYRTDGFPRRRRKYINGVPVRENDARMIRRWRAGKIKGVTVSSANALLMRYRLPTWQEINEQEDR